MKKEASGKKGKWLWLVLGLVVLLAVVGVVLALVLGGGNDKAVGGRPELYWNVDREANVDRDTGLSIREAAEDGNYYVRFAHDGEQVEIPVADKKLVNFIDSLDLMSLKLDDSGYVVDIYPVADVASVIGESLYVQNVSGNTIIANSSIMMNGRKVTIELNEQAGVYNVSGKGEFVGEPLDASTLNPMDTISIYGTLVPEESEEDPVVTHIFVLNKPAESEIYFRADQFYDSTNKVTTREPDENGAYTIKWYCNGETVDLKCKDKDMVSTIDSANYHWCHWGLEFDEEGYIIDILDSFLASRTLMQCERYDITEIYEDGSYTATSLIKNNGAFVQGVVGADCPIYDISSTAKSEGQDNRKVDSLKLGDRVCIWTDTMGNPVHIYVTRRQADSVGYWNVTRSYSSTTQLTTRKPNANGMYEIEMLKAGDTKNTIYYTSDVNIATAVDKTSDLCVGLKVGEGNVIECVYDIEAVFGYTNFVRGYYILDATASVCTYLSPSGSGYTKNGVLAADAKVWNVSTIGKYGEETTLQVGDYVYAGKTPIGEVAYAYVVRRTLANGENKFYWRTDTRMYDSTNKVTTRVPDAEGYYVYEFAHKGKLVTLKTKNKAFATALDYQSSAPAFALEVKGDIITAVHDGTYAYGGSRINSWTITEIDGDKFTATNSTGTSTSTYTMKDNCEIYNVSSSFVNNKGEKTTLKVGDVIAGYRNMEGQIQCIMVKTRRTNKMAWPVAPDANRQRAKDGWFYIDLAVDGKIRTYKCKSETVIRAVDAYTSPFGIQVSGDELLYMSTTTYVEGVKGSGVTTVTVDSVSGSSVKIRHTLGTAEKIGTTETLTLASNAKIYDVTEDAANAGKFGTAVKLKKGDVIRTYKDTDGNQLYIYVIARQTKDYYSYCAHCDKPVYWTPYVPSSNATSYDSHYYLATDLLDIPAQMRVYSTSRDYEIVLDLNGHTMNREGGRAALVRYGDTLTIIDSSAGQTGKITTKNNTSNGGVIMVSGSKTDGIGVLNIGAKVGDKYIYGGTITLAEDSKMFSSDGGLITNSGTVNLYNGKLLNGFAKSNEDGASGGAINTSGTFNMYGGEITGGKVEGWHTLEDGTIEAYTGAGGNISSSGTTNIYGGVIQNGVASRGGNVSVTGGTFTLHAGQIINGTADLAYGKTTDARGGNIFSTGNVHIKGGTVTGGKTVGKDYGGNIMSTGLKQTIHISGGTVSGGTYVNGETVKLSNIYLMYSNLEVSGGTIDGGEFTGTLIGGTGTNTGGYSTITISGGTIKGNVSGGGNVTTIEMDASGQTYYVSEGNRVNVYFHEDGSAYTLNSKNKEVAFYPNYKTVMNLTGGTVEGTVSAASTQQINVSGKPVINKLTIGSNLLNVGKMESGANITIDTIGIFSNKNVANASAYTGYFHAASEGFITGVTADNELKIYHPDSVAAYCAHCEGEADWMPWNGGSLGNGHYFADGDIQLTDEVANGAETVIDLRGHTITAAENSRCFYVSGGDLIVMDTSEGETGVITGGHATRGGNVYVSSGSFTLMSGTITGGIADNELGTSTTNGRGGNIFSNGEVFLLGGTVSNGVANNGSGYGGNICVTGVEAGVAISGDAVVTGGSAKSGGNIYLMYSNLIMDDGEISNGTAGSGGNIYTNSTATADGGCIVELIGGSISDGEVYLGGVYSDTDGVIVENRTVLILADTTLDCVVTAAKIGGLWDAEAGAYIVEPAVYITGKTVAKNLKLGEGVLLIANEMTEGASVAVNAMGVVSLPYADKAVAESLLANDYIVPYVAGVDIVVNDQNEIEIKEPTVSTAQFYCAHCQQTVEFKEWRGMPISEDGHYYLTGPVNLTSVITLSSSRNAVIDLNGQTITADGCRAFYLSTGATLSIQDSVGTGAITGGDSAGGRGGNIYATGANLHLYGGKIYGGTASTGNSAGHDIAVYNGEFEINGNVTIGQAYDNGYAVFAFSTTDLKLVKGDITGGIVLRSQNNATLGSELTVDTLALWTTKLAAVEARNSSEKIAIMVTGSTDDFLEGVFTAALDNAVTAATYFEAASAEQQIVVNADNTLEIKAAGSTEPDPGPGTDPEPGASCEHCTENVTWTPWTYTSGKVTTAGHYILEGNVTVTGKVIIQADVVIDLNGYTITTDQNIQIFQVNPDGILSIMDSSANETGTITGGDAKNTDSTSTYVTRGGNIIVAGGGTMNLYSGNITNGIAKSRGGNIYVTGSSTLNIYGGTVSGGVADSHANNIYSNGSTINIYGGTITDTSDNGVYSIAGCGYTSGSDYSAYLNIAGGTITGKYSFKADRPGSGNSVTETTISGGSISGTTYVAANRFEISGKPVIEKLSLGTDAVITNIGAMESGASVMIDATEGAFTAALPNAADVVGYFDAVDSAYNVAVSAENKLEVVEDTTGGNPGGDPEPVIPTFDCAHCDETVEWIAWDANTVVEDAIASGHYYLTGDVTIAETNIGILAENDVVIELNGYTITAPATTRAFYVYGTLSIQDSSAEKTGAIVGGNVTGGHGGTIYVTTDATLNIYGGTIVGGTLTGNNGGAIYATSATLNLYGGKVTGGTALRGGNIYVNKGTFNMEGGVVTDGVADNVLTDSGTNGRGGNIFLNNVAVTISGGEISNGVTINKKNPTYAGNLMISGAATASRKPVTISGDVVISGGEAKNGPNVALCYVTVDMTGGSILGGQVYMYGSEANGYSVLNMSAGTIDDLDAHGIDGLNVSGTAVINSLELGEGEVVTAGTFAEGAKITVNAESGAFTAAFADKAAAEAVLTYFDAVAHNKTVAVSAENALEVVASCECGCKATNVEWVDANAYIAEMATTNNVKIDENVHLKLSADLNIKEVYGGSKQMQLINNAVVTIDLNGFTWANEGHRAIYVNAGCKLTLMDSSEAKTGTLQTVGDPGYSTGGALLVYGDCDIRGGTLTMLNPGTTTTNGGVLYLNTSGTVNMYGGTITGGLATSSSSRNANGANVNIYNGTFNMYGGVISNGTANGTADKASYGGNIYVRNASTASANLYGGTITGGTADIGGSIYAEGAIFIAPEMVIDGDVYLVGNNVNTYLANNLVYEDGGAYILQNVTLKLGDNVDIAEIIAEPVQLNIGKNDTPVTVTIDLNGYTWTGNHRIRLMQYNTLNIKDSSAEKTGVMQSTGCGTNAGRVISSYGTLNIYGGTMKMIEDETVHVNGGGLIYISMGEINLYGGVIEGGKVVANDTKADGHAYGGNVYVYRGTFNIYGGTIKDGSATGSETYDAFGGNICMRYGTTLNIEGGTISGGISTDSGSNICLGTKLDGSNGAVINKSGEYTIENEDTSVEVAAAVKPA